MSKKKKIIIEVEIDDDNMPSDILWLADDAANGATATSSKAMLLSLFDRDHRDTLRIDLWTKDMQVAEMDRFMYNSLKGLADTYYRASQNKALASAMQQFSQFFGEQTEVLPKS